VEPAHPYRPLVVGAPRSGFALLASVLIHFVPLAPGKLDLRQRVLNALARHLGDHVSASIVKAFARRGISGDLLYNANFRYVVGGPKWLKQGAPDTACFRKYIGVRGMGDFTLVTSHPRELLDLDEVVHSHSDPGLWLEHPAYRDYAKYASVRNPIGIVNSAVFSLNALSSEYIQKFVPPDRDNHLLREQLALYKLTDLDFYEGLVRFLAPYLREFLRHRHGYTVMRWEDLITDPVPTIRRLGAAGGIEVPEDLARTLWAKLDRVNLTQAHKHNYRPGAGVVDDWKAWIANEHLEIARRHGLEEIALELGYGRFGKLDESRYTPFQRQVAGFLRRGEVHREFFDRDLFTFAFNKSNLVSDKFPFRRPGWREHTQIERSIFEDEALERAIWDVAESATGELNAFLRDFLDASHYTQADALRHLRALRRRHETGLGASDPVRYAEAFRAAEQEARGGAPLPARILSYARRAFGRLRRMALPAAPGAADTPRLIERLKGYDIVFYKGVYYGLPQSLGPVRLDSHETRRLPGVIDGTTRESVRDAIVELTVPRDG
jgi:hypothetical protein